MKLIRHLSIVCALVLASVVQVVAQTTLNSTTLSAAVNATTQIIPLTSVSTLAVGQTLVVLDGNVAREAMRVNAVGATTVTVTRGINGTAARAHVALATVYTGATGRFYANEVAGGCTAANEEFLPHIVFPSGNVYQCSPAGVWYRLDQTITVSCWTGALATGSIDQTCWQADGNYVVTGISYVSTVAESGGTLTVIPRRQEGTEAAASGDALATALSGVSTVAQTVTAFSLTATSALLLLNAGDRLGIDFTDDVAGELAGVVVTFTLARY